MSDRLELRDLTNPPLLIATWWGAGLFPFAPGTAGSLAALPLIWLAADWALWLQFSMIAILFVVGVWASQKIAQVRGGHDQGFIVIDEVIGQWLTLLLPLGMAADTLPPWTIYALGFVCFRFFDILKPPPIGWLDRHVKGGLGVMLDDAIAGAFASGVLVLVLIALQGS